MATAAAKKTEPAPKKTEATDDVQITNIQKIGVLRFHGRSETSPLSDYVEIQPGETKPVPMRIWKNYSARTDVEAHDRVHFIVGGLKPGEEMKTPTAQAQALALREKDVAAREAELALYESKLESTRQELEAAKEALHEGH